jgi:hypothetical protein
LHLLSGNQWNDVSGTYPNNIGYVVEFSVIAGDYNLDGAVDAADYVAWRKTVGSTTNLTADGNGNQQIDPGDYDVWRAHFGQTAGSGAGASSNAAVPEPATFLLLMFGVAGFYLGRRRTA